MAHFDPTVSSHYGIPTSLTDASGRRLLVSDAYAELIQRPKDELIGADWQSIAHPDDLRDHASKIKRLVEGGVPYESRWRMHRGDGRWLSGLIYGTRLIDPVTGAVTLQGNMMVQGIFAEAEKLVPPPDDAFAVADYIRTMTRDLSRLARSHDMPFLQHLLSMANAEAVGELERRLAPGAAAFADATTALN